MERLPFSESRSGRRILSVRRAHRRYRYTRRFHLYYKYQEYCHFTTNPNRSKEADAWLYHNRDFLPQMMESRGDAVHVILCHESPTYETILYTANTINWTMTYKRGSDIVIPYGTFAKNGKTTVGKNSRD